MKERFIREIGHIFMIVSKLGRGAFGTVLECVKLSSSKSVALKVIKKYKLTEKVISSSIQESELLSTLDHENIVKFIDLHYTDSFLILEMELLRGNTLANLLLEKKLTETEAAKIMKMIFQGVAYLHKIQVLHRDLKPENIMFQDEDQTILKITDFGLSTKYTLGESLSDRSGTMAYMAPEALLKQYGEPIDIWSCGIIMYKLLTNNHPVSIKRDDMQEYAKKLQKINWTFPDSFPPLAKDLFLRCTKIDPVERYSANLALQHPWITREKGKIPVTHMEEIRIYQDMFKLKKLIVAAVHISGTVPRNAFDSRYEFKLLRPYDEMPVEEVLRKKNCSLGVIEFKEGKEKKNTHKPRISYGNRLNVPGAGDSSNFLSSPTEFGHKRASSRIISRSPSPYYALPKTASKQKRHNFITK